MLLVFHLLRKTMKTKRVSNMSKDLRLKKGKGEIVQVSFQHRDFATWLHTSVFYVP
jgi:hypothetical protein